MKCGADLPSTSWAQAHARRAGCQNAARWRVRLEGGSTIATPCGQHVKAYRRFTGITIDLMNEESKP